ncbi:unnamed protein product [Soboliphyme baturini]|uniref:Succinyl-CoA synthetase beta chain n=1 Tax=Soboliphyme baturini TaxID=241478 RepID=A0A183J6G8_9BILA|nr:unnamed protein product [Soboliphyme baturini]
MIAERIHHSSENYVAILMDREESSPVIVVSPVGGVNIEETAKSSPHLIFTVSLTSCQTTKEVIDIQAGLTEQQALTIAQKLNFKDKIAKQVAEQLQRLYRMFIDVDATQIEINPLAITTDGRVCCVDAKLNFDDSAEFRQQRIFAMHSAETQPLEHEAHKHQLNYVGLSGNIGCMVNGAGLAMATMDMIKMYGGEPANFLDLRGSVTTLQVFHALGIIVSDSKVKTVLVNIFGGIVDCQIIAEGIIAGVEHYGLSHPFIIRLDGTNKTSACETLKASGIPMLFVSELDQAAIMAVENAKQFA